MVLYVGHRVDDETVVFKNDNGAVTRFVPDSSQELRHNFPDDFNWGYIGSKPIQLALSLLLDATGDKVVASNYHLDFSWDFVVLWKNEWNITDSEIKDWLNNRAIVHQPIRNMERIMR